MVPYLFKNGTNINAMNSSTRNKLDTFITQIQVMTHGLILTIGIETATNVLSAAEDLKNALKADDTIEI